MSSYSELINRFLVHPIMCKQLSKIIILYFSLCLVFVFLGCTTTPVANTVSKNKINSTPLDGIWIGEFDIRGRGPYDFTVVNLDHKAYAYSLKAKAMCIGTFTFDGEHSIHKYVLFALDGGPFDWATVTGTLKKNDNDQNLLASHFKTLNGGDTGALNIAYNEIYEQPSSFETIQGAWSFTDKDNLTTQIVIDEKGTLEGDDSDGCRYDGSISLINPDNNLYKVNLDISACSSVTGDYSGVSFVKDEIFTMQIANPQYALYYAFERN